MAAVFAAATAVTLGCGQADETAAEVEPAAETTAPPSPTVAAAPAATASLKATETPAAAATPRPSESAAPTATASASPAASAAKGYDPNANMYLIFAGSQTTPDNFREALARTRLNDDGSQAPVIIDMMRILGFGDFAAEAALTLRALTGQQFGGGRGDWSRWVEWLGKNSDKYRPPSRYPAWKANLFATLIDPRYALFLGSAKISDRIDLTEVAWGGVAPDGIPDLNQPPYIEASVADYLALDDRVFGVSINGEHRAYPVRILNPHEMANDYVGGEPIALAY